MIDEDLVQQFLKNNQQDWEILQDRYREPLIAVVIAMTNWSSSVLRGIKGEHFTVNFSNHVFDKAATRLQQLAIVPPNFAFWLYRFILDILNPANQARLLVKPVISNQALGELQGQRALCKTVDLQLIEEAVLEALVTLGKTHREHQEVIVLKRYAKRWKRVRKRMKLVKLNHEDIGRILGRLPGDLSPADPATVRREMADMYHQGMGKLGKILRGNPYV